MKILIAVHHFPPRYTAGAEQRALRMAHALRARGHAVQVICVEDVHADPHQPPRAVDDLYQSIPVRRLHYNARAASRDPRNEFDSAFTRAQVAALIARFKPDVLHLISGYLMTGSALTAAREAGVPSVVSLTDFWFLCPRIQFVRSDGALSSLPIDPRRCARCVAEESRRYRLPARVFPALAERYWRGETRLTGLLRERHAFLLNALNSAAAIISPSQFLRGVFVDAGVEPTRIVYSRQGREFPAQIDAPPARARGGALRIGLAGTLMRLKGQHVAVEAMRQIASPHVRLEIYGGAHSEPAYASKLAAACARDGRISLHAPYRAEDISRVVSGFDAMLVPSLWYENSPNVVLEAFAHHKPVIASALGGMAELVQHGVNGLTFPAGDARALAAQIQRLLDEPGLLNALARGIQPVKGVAAEMEELERIYEGVAADAVRSAMDGVCASR